MAFPPSAVGMKVRSPRSRSSALAVRYESPPVLGESMSKDSAGSVNTWDGAQLDDINRNLDDLCKRAQREPRRRQHDLYFHGTSYGRNSSIRKHGIRVTQLSKRGPFLAKDAFGAFLIGVRDLWRTDDVDDRCIVYAVRAPSSALQPHEHELVEWTVRSGRVPPEWILAHEIVRPSPSALATTGHMMAAKFVKEVREEVLAQVTAQISR